MKDESKAPALLIGFGAPKGAIEEGDEDSGALAGKALIRAIKSGDGQAVYDAFEALKRECDGDGHDDKEELDDSDHEL